jgi:hypothetical protein
MKLICAFLLAFPSLAQAFWLDSMSPLGAKSTVHYDVVKSTALCLGYSQADSEQIANYSQATDIPAGFNGVTLDFVDHDGPNAAYIHAPQLVTGVDALSQLKQWALGQIPYPAGMPEVTNQVKALAGTLGAYGVYLHALGDKYSHGACINAGYVPHCSDQLTDGNGEGSYFHLCTSAKEQSLCHYKLAHDNEFGDNRVLSKNTYLGLQAIYSDLATRRGLPGAVPSSLLSLFYTFSNTMDAATRTGQAASIAADPSCRAQSAAH